MNLTVVKAENVVEDGVISVHIQQLESLAETLLVLMVNGDITGDHNHNVAGGAGKLGIKGDDFRLNVGNGQILKK